ncbi:hypothetical protein HO133_001964 [Letharia lupina]|uniref:CENP-V/GFA domain-containing protein n=1 Tax=Letharia lupina TaxID=560253 RepID=A0A8H6CF04_9LECA|nr:uncharacterized protein HO133_001964 [Letharia lupina]KAF6221996.1 hypothetical protein HO133_001964 [Letharia lupina]
MPPPTTITGGCLCGAIRYELNLGGPSGWPPKTHTCQCTQCRKRSGALLTAWIDTAPSRLLWSSPAAPGKTASPADLPAFAEYSASAGRHRGFCATCGSPLTWRSEGSAGELEVATGSVDGEVLGGEAGAALGRASAGHYWCGNRIEGVTDLEAGRRFEAGEGSGEVGGGGRG